jgi:hypothetical protein
MQLSMKANNYSPAVTGRLVALQLRLVQFSIFNLFLVSLVGILLRSYPFIDNIPLQYKNVLHGHSHFAFGGWVTPALLAVFLKLFPQLSARVHYRHWRNICILMLAAAYGMLLSFPVQGYKAVSISFSTLSIAAGMYMAVVIWKGMRQVPIKISHRFVQWGLIYSVISAAGPFATAPLIAMGQQGTPLYFDVIYFYLHFQYNGMFTFFVLAFLYSFIEKKNADNHGGKVFLLFNIACLPTFALSVLWNQPPGIFNLIGGIGALLQIAGLLYLLKDLKNAVGENNFSKYLLWLSMAAFILKNVLQALSALSVVASMAHNQRNFVIAYLHLVLLGFVSVFLLAQFKTSATHVRRFDLGLVFFFVAFITTELLLAGNAFAFYIPSYLFLLLAFSCLFPVAFWLMFSSMKRSVSLTIKAQNLQTESADWQAKVMQSNVLN